ncbi:MAG: hypothetical protein HY658_11375 [Actinobacteria bacterium]|nr:hypothetical protein [Actinomycetota bacterium]
MPAAFLTGLILVLVLFGVYKEGGREPVRRAGGRFTEPFVGGRKATLAEADRLVNYPLYRPNDPMASDSTIREVWIDEPGGQVAFEYADGLIVFLSEETFDPEQMYENQIKEGVPGKIVTVNGRTALVVSADELGPGSIDFLIDGIEISIIGNLEAPDLIRIAESVSALG